MTAQAGGAIPLSHGPAARMAQASAEVRAARRRLRELRLGLDARTRAAAQRAIHAGLERLGVFRRGARVALYLPLPGEVDLRPCLDDAAQRGVRIYVPRIVSRRHRRMVFAPWTRAATLRRNFHGVDEPAATSGARAASGLDVVVVPVVGFDRDGNRLGMGAGYYDRALRRRRDAARPWRRPRVLGVAFACQELPAIPASPWDVPLDLVVTERGVIVPRRHASPRHVA